MKKDNIDVDAIIKCMLIADFKKEWEKALKEAKKKK
jgi:hypothetical protein